MIGAILVGAATRFRRCDSDRFRSDGITSRSGGRVLARFPWDTGDIDRNWTAYFIPGSGVLRNLVGATTAAELQDAENDLSEFRLLELRENPDIVSRTYDLEHLRGIHRQLFQDVYEWSGHPRTVGLERDGESFCPPGSLDMPMGHVALKVAETHR